MGTNIFIINILEDVTDTYKLSVNESVSIPIQEHSNWFFISRKCLL